MRGHFLETYEQIKLWAREIKAIAQTGLAYEKDVFDKERYNQMNDISVNMLSYISGIDVDEINKNLPLEMGYTTPKIAVRGIIIKNDKLLMVKEKADGLWSLPGGWCDVGITPSENVEKEIVEETGLTTKANKLLAVFDQTKRKPSVTLQYIYNIYFSCDIIGGTLKNSIETDDVGFFPINQLPPLSTERVTTRKIKLALEIATNEGSEAYFD